VEQALFLGCGPVPFDYTVYQLCMMYHCTPSELDEQDWNTVNLHREFALLDQKHQ